MSTASFLALLPHWGFGFLLLFARAGSAMMLLPGLGESQIPRPIRLAVAVTLCALVLPTLIARMPPVPAGIADAAALIGAEVLAGLWFGWLARLVLFAWPMAGDFIAYMIGLSSVFRAGALGSELNSLFALAVPALILSSGLYALPLVALVQSYHTLGPGLALNGGDAARVILGTFAASFTVAFRLAAPFILAGVVWQIGLGLLSRLVPAIQVYFVAMPAQILGGLLLLAALAATMAGGFADYAREALSHLGALP